MGRLYTTPNEIGRLSVKLARKIYEDGFSPDVMLATYCGGAVISAYMRGVFRKKGLRTEDYPIQGSSYSGEGQRSKTIKLYSINDIIEILNGKHEGINGNEFKRENILIADDVFDEGLTSSKIKNRLLSDVKHPIKIKTSMLHWKPTQNKTSENPDYYLESLPEAPWIVYPHEIEDMKTKEEFDLAFPYIDNEDKAFLLE